MSNVIIQCDICKEIPVVRQKRVSRRLHKKVKNIIDSLTKIAFFVNIL